jgi:hypothetical protein
VVLFQEMHDFGAFEKIGDIARGNREANHVTAIAGLDRPEVFLGRSQFALHQGEASRCDNGRERPPARPDKVAVLACSLRRLGSSAADCTNFSNLLMIVLGNIETAERNSQQSKRISDGLLVLTA